MFDVIVSVLAVLGCVFMRAWLIVLGLLCMHALRLVDYLYPATVPLWLTLSLAGVLLVMLIHHVFKQSRRRDADPPIA
ncbi:hypothetical protein [Rugamonas rivuli]|uniref:Uncharacterized protein n=1 Tax=Rugamonas rivuli TaxID=2743358 RepID=A0A843SIL7_9BURK|nr:hypothetical protein [Rugamonas rivuli]MQA21981.1 hypothetical protein [Rugamonas rivuli]